MRQFAKWLPTQWSKFSLAHIVLLPLSWCFGWLVYIRRCLYHHGIFRRVTLPVPVIIVGNINVGGTGKTPLVIYLAKLLKDNGFQPGIISRGFGADINAVKAVNAQSKVDEVGDEPVLICQRTQCPVYVGRKRTLVAQALLADYPRCDVIISDDGLQHYHLDRSIELVVVDGVIGFGNGALLPAGPLRESTNRLQQADLLVVNGGWQQAGSLNTITSVPNVVMQLQVGRFYCLNKTNQQFDASHFLGKNITAIAGIGNPKRFFDQLSSMGLSFNAKSYPDHYAFAPSDIASINADIILMTEKDAVKCKVFADDRCWVLPIDAHLDEAFASQLITKVKV